MARKNKNIVDYFPLPCVFSDSITAIEDMFDNNDGFVVWVKLLQKLGRSENHFVDCRNTVQRKIFFSKFKIPEERIISILDALAELDCIDKEMWDKQVIFSQLFVDDISDVYKRRKTEPLSRDEICLNLFGKCLHKNNLCIHNANNNAQSKAKEIKEEEKHMHVDASFLNSFFDFLKKIPGFEPDIKQDEKLCIDLLNTVDGNKNAFQMGINEWLSAIVSKEDNGACILNARKRLFGWVKKYKEKYKKLVKPAKRMTPSAEETQAYLKQLDEVSKLCADFNLFIEARSREEAINAIIDVYPQSMRGRTSWQKN